MHRDSPRPPFCREVLRPSSAPRPAPFLAPPSSRRFQKGLEGGASPPPLAASHRAPANRERTRHPLPLFTQVERGARFEWEMFARAFWAGDLGGRCPFTHLLLLPLRSFHPSRGDRDRTVFVEWRVVKMVVAQLWKLVSWREWSDCWRRDCCRRGVNGVIVEMLVVAMFVVVLCTKITTYSKRKTAKA